MSGPVYSVVPDDGTAPYLSISTTLADLDKLRKEQRCSLLESTPMPEGFYGALLEVKGVDGFLYATVILMPDGRVTGTGRVGPEFQIPLSIDQMWLQLQRVAKTAASVDRFKGNLGPHTPGYGSYEWSHGRLDTSDHKRMSVGVMRPFGGAAR